VLLFSPALATYGDKLTAFGSESITYDEYGRTSRYRGKNIFYGGYDAHNISYFGNASFTYYEDGMRRTKAVGNVTHYYTYDGINLIREEWGNNTLVFLYDASGSPIGMQYRNSSYASGVWDTYYYEKNLQGDIIAVYNSSGTKLVTYTYDAWGYIISTTYSNGGASTAAAYNPLKYRGYYYDDDLDLYYLATRYYDPEVCRFITADSYVSTGQGILGYNRYAYCNNNPVMYVDPSGKMLGAIISLIAICGAVLVLSSCNNNDEPTEDAYKYHRKTKESDDLVEGAVNYYIYEISDSDGVAVPCIRIYNSHMYRDEKDQREILNYIINLEGDTVGLSSSDIDYYIQEWKFHNFAYDNPKLAASFLKTTEKSVIESSMHVDLNVNDPNSKLYKWLGWLIWQ